MGMVKTLERALEHTKAELSEMTDASARNASEVMGATKSAHENYEAAIDWQLEAERLREIAEELADLVPDAHEEGCGDGLRSSGLPSRLWQDSNARKQLDALKARLG